MSNGLCCGRFWGKGYDSATLDREMQEHYGMEMIAPHRRDRAHPTEDGRPLRRCRRRWTVERLFAWLQRFRRLAELRHAGLGLRSF
jgi:transposase